MNVQKGSTPDINFETFKKLHPKQFYSTFIKQGFRPDSRKLWQHREISVSGNTMSQSNTVGSSIAKIGNTCVVCGIKGEITKPAEHDPSKGFAFISMDIPDISVSSSQSYKWSQRKDDSKILSYNLQNILDQFLDHERLSIVKEKAAWVLYIDLICLEHDGNLIEASLLAITKALKSVYLPSIKLTKMDEFKIVQSEEEDKMLLKKFKKSENGDTDSPESLDVNMEEESDEGEDEEEIVAYRSELEGESLLLFHPFAFSFATMLNDEEIIIADPTFDEELLCSSSLTIILNNKTKEMCQVLQTSRESSGVRDLMLMKCIKHSKNEISKLEKIMNGK